MTGSSRDAVDSGSAGPRLLLVEDDPDVVDLIIMNLSAGGYRVDVATEGPAGLAKAKTGNHDLIILDVMLPKLSGFQICEQLRYEPATRAVPILLLTAKGTLNDKEIGFGKGADDYLLKPFEPRELELRIHSLLRRAGRVTVPSTLAEILEAGDIQLNPTSLQIRLGERLISLTPTEFEIIYCLLQHTDQPVPHATLLNEVWGFDADETVDMLRVHIRHIRKKLEVDPNHPQHLLTVHTVGYRLAISPQMDCSRAAEERALLAAPPPPGFSP